jgi:hypothetical protein
MRSQAIRTVVGLIVASARVVGALAAAINSGEHPNTSL